MTSSKKLVIGLAFFALLGAIFAGISTYDFIAHLDRQVHAITCAFVPGLSAKDATGSSGCYAALMSPYSSVLRQTVWGGIPIALPGLAVFAYLLFLALDVWYNTEVNDAGKLRYAAWAAAFPVLVSVVYVFISLRYVGSFCKLCVGIYFSSLGAFLCAILAARQADATEVSDRARRSSSGMGRYLLYFAEGVVFVSVAVILYLGLSPAYAAELSRCGELLRPEDKYGVTVSLSSSASGVDAIEVFDPLCPACKNFAERLEASGLLEKLRLRAVMFPLDTECNWMIKSSLHPGACAVSEAVLCAGNDAQELITWVFANQKELRELAERSGSAAVQRRIREHFPALGTCMGKPEVKAKINRSLRWIVANSLSVLTPQLFVKNRKLCDEDTDLGLEYSLSRLLDSVPSGSASGRNSR
jgi:uncharacterized membrane protein